MNGHAGCNVMTPQCHVTIPIKINMIFLDIPGLKGLKIAIENITKMVFFRRFLAYVICQWSHFNAPHKNLTLIFFK